MAHEAMSQGFTLGADAEVLSEQVTSESTEDGALLDEAALDHEVSRASLAGPDETDDGPDGDDGPEGDDED